MFYVGDVWVPIATVTNPRSANPAEPVEPGTCTYTFLSSRGRETTPVVTRRSQGVFEAQQELTEPGTWKCWITTTIPYQAAQLVEIPVHPKFGG